MPSKYQRFLNKDTTSFNSKVKSFIKKEKVDLSKNKKPRLIQANSMQYNIEIGRYTKKFEHILYEVDKQRKDYIFAKGIDLLELGQYIEHHSNRYRKPKYLCLDHSTFDAYVTPEHKRLAAKVILKAYRNNPLLQKYLLMKNFTGQTEHGIKYTVEGTINSGSPITSLYANLINYSMLHYVCKKILKIPKFSIIVNGDDSIIFTEEHQFINQSQIIKELAKLNFKTKIEQITTNKHELEFCRCRFAYDNTNKLHAYLVPDRIIKTLGQTPKTIHRISYLRDIAYAYSIIYKNFEQYHNKFKQLYLHFNKQTGKPLFKAIKLEPFIHAIYEKEKSRPRVKKKQPHSSQPVINFKIHDKLGKETRKTLKTIIKYT